MKKIILLSLLSILVVTPIFANKENCENSEIKVKSSALKVSWAIEFGDYEFAKKEHENTKTYFYSSVEKCKGMTGTLREVSEKIRVSESYLSNLR